MSVWPKELLDRKIHREAANSALKYTDGRASEQLSVNMSAKPDLMWIKRLSLWIDVWCCGHFHDTVALRMRTHLN